MNSTFGGCARLRHGTTMSLLHKTTNTADCGDVAPGIMGTHASIFDRPQREDRRVGEQGRPKERGTLQSRKAPGKARKLDAKARTLLQADVKERPYATLQQHCDYIEAASGILVSRSTVCRAIAGMYRSRKKGDEPPQSATSLAERPGYRVIP